MSQAKFARVALAAYALNTSACTWLDTRPGHPDSYIYTDYYKHAGRWRTSDIGNKACAGDASTQAADLRCKDTSPPPPGFVTTNAPFEIWQARGYAHNMAVQYTAASYKSQDVQDLEVVPLIGVAVATAAVAIAKASTVAVAATGIGASAGGAAYTYAHPDTDAGTEQDAAAQLACIVDESQPLHSLTSVTLILDRAAIEDAEAALQTGSQKLLQKSKPTAAEKAQMQAVQDALKAAGTEVTLLGMEIKSYDQIAKAIYTAADTVDAAAKKGGRRAFDFSAITQQIKSAATTQSTKSMAMESSATASGSEKAASDMAGTPAPMPILADKLDNLMAVTATVMGSSGEAGRRTAVSLISQDDKTVPPLSKAGGPPVDDGTGGVAGDGKHAMEEKQQAVDKTAAKYASLSSMLTSGSGSDPGLLNRLVENAHSDDPEPGFGEISTSIAGCVLKAASAAK